MRFPAGEMVMQLCEMGSMQFHLRDINLPCSTSLSSQRFHEITSMNGGHRENAQ